MMPLFLLGILFLLFFTVLYDTADVRVFREDELTISVSLTIFEFSFKLKDGGERTDPSVIIERFRPLGHCLRYILPRTDVTLRRFYVARVPRSPADIFPLASRLAFASVVVAYVGENAKTLRVSDGGASQFAPTDYRGELPALDVTFSTRLFCLIIFLVIYQYYTVKRKRGRRYGRKQNKRYSSRLG